MTDEAAECRDPATTDAPAPAQPPPPTAGPPPAWGYDTPAGPPPAGVGFTSRYGLVRPRDGRYLAGVCAAIGRATNTDPILWRVLLAVLGFFGGIGILVYVTAWLIIPGEGDTASPVESMLGRGRSSMSPITVIVLSILVAVSLGFIVTDTFRAVLLGAAILIGGALLLNRDGTGARTAGGSTPAPSGPAPGGAGTSAAQPAPAPWATGVPATPTSVFPGGAYPGPVPPVVPGPPGTPAAAGPGSPPGYPATQWPYPASHPAHQPSPYPGAAGPSSAPTEPLPLSAASPAPAPPVGGPPGPPPPSGGYRPAFAPHGPYAPADHYTPGGAPPVRPPKPPKERSPLGAATFSMVFVVIGVVALLDLAHVITVAASAYFAAALTTIALGLLVGTWFGRARWLIALGLVAAAALGVATVAESYRQVHGTGGNVNWSPQSHAMLADRYENSFGNATLDLRGVEFANRDTRVSAAVNFGRLTVIVPPNVDVTTVVNVNAGNATVFGSRWSGYERRGREVTDLGADGAGGGHLRLNLHVNAGDAEVSR